MNRATNISGLGFLIQIQRILLHTQDLIGFFLRDEKKSNCP
jgi:hypothetical protein